MTTKPTIQASASSKMMSPSDQQTTNSTTKSKRSKKFVSIRNVLGVGGRKRKKRTNSDRTMGGSSDNEEDNNIPTTSVQATGTSSSELPRVFTPTRDLTNMTTDADAHGKLSPSSVGTTETVSSVEEELLPSRFDPPGSLSPSFRQFDRPIPSRRRTTGGASRRRSSSKSGVKERNMVKLAKRYGEVAEELRCKNTEIEKLSMSQAVLKAKVENMKEQERWYKSHISQLIKGQAAFQANLESVNLSSDDRRQQQSEIDDICRYHENLTMQIHQKHAKKYKELQMDLQEELAHIEGGCVELTDDEKTDDDKTDDDISVTETMRDHLVVLAKKKEESAAGAKEGSWGWSLLCGLLLAAGVASTLKFSMPPLLRGTRGVLPSEDKATSSSLSSEFVTATQAVVDESLALFFNSSVEVPTEKESALATDLSTVTRIPKKEEEGKVELFFNSVAVPEEMSFPAYDEEDMYEEDMWNTFGQRPNMSPPFHNLF